MKNSDKPLQDRLDRRTFLTNAWNWTSLAAACVLLYPLLRFVSVPVPRKPRKKIINKVLLPGNYVLEEDFALFQTASGPVALSRICTHLGCRLDFSEAENLLVCPCHQSKFTLEGKRVAGPATRDLPVYKVERLKGEDQAGYIVTF
jgi:cytochrome b6-f complex iron-sulfur subunit